MNDISNTVNMAENFIKMYGSTIIAFAAIIAVFLTNWLNHRTERNNKLEQALRVQSLINLEIEQNILSIQNFWSKFNKFLEKYGKKYNISYPEEYKANKLALQPLFKWRDITWRTQIYYCL